MCIPSREPLRHHPPKRKHHHCFSRFHTQWCTIPTDRSRKKHHHHLLNGVLKLLALYPHSHSNRSVATIVLVWPREGKSSHCYKSGVCERGDKLSTRGVVDKMEESSHRVNDDDDDDDHQSRSPFRPSPSSDDPHHSPVSYNASFASTPRNSHELTSNNSNNNQNNSNNNIRVEVMERVLFHLHSRICNFSLVWTSTRTRKLVEHVLLVAAICCFGALILLHRSFVTIKLGSSNINSQHNNVNETKHHHLCLHSLPGGFDPLAADITHLIVLPPAASSSYAANSQGGSISQYSQVVWKRKNCVVDSDNSNYNADSCLWDTKEGGNAASLSWITQQEQSGNLPIHYSYSTTKGYLMLPANHRIVEEHLNIQYVLISRSDSACFGEPFIQFLIWNCFIGPDTVLLNWLQSLHIHYVVASETEAGVSSSKLTENEGYVYNPRTKRILELPHPNTTKETHHGDSNQSDWRHNLPTLMSKLGILAKTAFLFFFCTTLVSFTLRETQERMLDFTRELSRRVQQALPVSDLIGTHLIQNLVFVPIMVGMMFFLIEFYNGDKFLAFSVSSIVWCVESFSVISLRSTQGILYFPKFFFLLFLLFHVYQAAYKETGFVYTALTVVWCFMFHSMVFFWHRFELPAVALGHVTVDRPRIITTRFTFDSGEQLQHPSQQQIFSSPARRPNPAGSTEATPRVGNLPHNPHGSLMRLPRAIMPTRSVSSTSSTGAGVPSGPTNNVSSHPSFSTASSRNTGLFRHNHDDENSTGSLLYFMGGEVVVHRGVPITSHPILPPATISRVESNFSLQSTGSDTPGTDAYSCGGSAVGLDVSESRRSYDDEDLDGDEFGSVPNTTSMDTVPSSNITTQPTPKKQKVNGHEKNPIGTTTDHYAHESGGLQAILESKLTPRHSNGYHDGTQLRKTTENTLILSNRMNSNAHQSSQAYQRTPPTFPDLPSNTTKG